jgi:hypothetical protein
MNTISSLFYRGIELSNHKNFLRLRVAFPTYAIQSCDGEFFMLDSLDLSNLIFWFMDSTHEGTFEWPLWDFINPCIIPIYLRITFFLFKIITFVLFHFLSRNNKTLRNMVRIKIVHQSWSKTINLHSFSIFSKTYRDI